MKWKRVPIVVLLSLCLAIALAGCVKTSEIYSDGSYNYEMKEHNKEVDEAFIHEQYEAAKENMENIYYNVLEEVTTEDGPLKQGGTEYWYGLFLRAYLRIREAAPIIIAMSMFIGIVVAAMSRENKKLRRGAIVWLIILIPLFTLAIVWGIAMTPLFRYK